MKPPPRLRLEPRPSRIACAAITTGCAAMALLVLLLPLDIGTTLMAILAIILVAGRGLWRCSGRGVPAILHVGHDRRITASSRDGRSCDGSILDDSYVGECLMTIVWRPDRAAWYELARTILILRDTLPADDLRRLRVLMRYGRALVDEETSGRTAG
jgi:Membrane-bound toxin component of toxin-antitoxin system